MLPLTVQVDALAGLAALTFHSPAFDSDEPQPRVSTGVVAADAAGAADALNGATDAIDDEGVEGEREGEANGDEGGETSAVRWTTSHSAALDALLPHCRRLRTLRLRGLTSLRELPPSVAELPPPPRRPRIRGQIAPLAAVTSPLLEMMDLSGCSVRTLPAGIARLLQLRELRLDWCGSLQRLPDTLGALISLRRFSAIGCELLRHLPESLGEGRRIEP